MNINSAGSGNNNNYHHRNRYGDEDAPEISALASALQGLKDGMDSDRDRDRDAVSKTNTSRNTKTNISMYRNVSMNSNSKTKTNRNNTKMDLITLPLLSSLHPDTTRPIVHRLLRECRAQRIIRSFLRRCLSERQRQRQRQKIRAAHADADASKTVQGKETAESQSQSQLNSNTYMAMGTNTDSTTQHPHDGHPHPHSKPRPHTFTVPCARQHFLFEALSSSSSLPVRQNACRILLDAADSRERITTLCDVLWDMIRDDMRAFLSLCHSHSSHGHRSHSQSHSHHDDIGHGQEYEHVHQHENLNLNYAHTNTREGIVQLYGLMTHCLFARDNAHTTRYYQFVYRGGLEWITSHILQLINLLMMQTRSSSNRNQQQNVINNANANANANATLNVGRNLSMNMNVKKGDSTSGSSDSDCDGDGDGDGDETTIKHANTNTIHVSDTSSGSSGTKESESASASASHSPNSKPSISTLSSTSTATTSNVLSQIFSSPSIIQPRHYFTTVTQSNNMSACYGNTILSAHAMGVVSEEEIKDRLCILVDFCLRITVLAHEHESDSNNGDKNRNSNNNSSSNNEEGDNYNDCEMPMGYDSEEEGTGTGTGLGCKNVNNDVGKEYKHGHVTKKSMEYVHDYLWRKCGSGDEIIGAISTGTGANTASASSAHAHTHTKHKHALSKVSPLGSLLAASFILRNKGDMVLSAEDHIMMPDKRLDRINWMLARMVDVNGEIIVVPKEKDASTSKDKKKRKDAGAGGPGSKKRKRDESVSRLSAGSLGVRETARTLASSLLHRAPSHDHDSSGQNQEVGSASSSARDATERLLSRIAKRARGSIASGGNTTSGVSSGTGSDPLGSVTARAILRAVTGGGSSARAPASTSARTSSGGRTSSTATTAGSDTASSRSRPSEGFSTAAEVMARTMSLSLLDRVHGRDVSDSTAASGAGSATGGQSRLASLMALERSSRSGRGNGDGGGDDDGDDDHGDEDEDDDDYETGNEGKNDDTEQEDGECADHDEDEDDESIHQEVEEEADEENGTGQSMEIDEEIESDDEKVFGAHEDEDEEDEEMLDNIIVEVASDPFQDDLMIVDSLDGNHRSGQPLADILGGTRRKRAASASASAPATSTNDKSKAWRSQAYLRASMELLDAQYPAIHLSHNGPGGKRDGEGRNRDLIASHRNPILTPSAEQSMLQSICDIIKPPKKPLKLKVFMRRAPTQEEFFRGSLSRNPILISSISIDQGASEPTVKDLRQHIANDLQMADSAELLELLVAKKILDMNLKLRVVSQTLWRTHVMDNVTTVNSESSFRQLMSGSSLGESGLLSRSRVDENTPMSALPPMVVTYRLAGVDGEATEDKVEEGDLVDPDAPPDTDASKAEYEKKLEKEFGITRDVTRGRGIGVLLRSLEAHLGQILQRIRRDDVDTRSMICGRIVQRKNATRSLFLKSPPCSTLKLLQHCAMLSDNRKKLVKAQAPTILLRLLLDVLNSIDQNQKKKQKHQIQVLQSPEEGGNDENISAAPSSPTHTMGNNPTADALQELIEKLSSDISAEMSKKSMGTSIRGDEEMGSEESSDDEGEGASTLPMLLSSLRTTSLSPPLRKVIAKLLPFLTYGQVAQSRALASQFIRNIQLEFLGGDASLYGDNDGENKAVLMETFVDAAIHLPPVSVCDTLRSELIRQGFVDNINSFILSSIPESPPSWTPALFAKTEKQSENDKEEKQNEWKRYYNRNGLQTAFEILIGLCKEHSETQSYLANIEKDSSPETTLTTAAHWIESTSDKDDVKTNGLGILAETLLDTMLQDNEVVKSKISSLRKKTRERKKELAQERRSRALVDMSAFGRLAGDVGLASKTAEETVAKSETNDSICLELRSAAANQKNPSPKKKKEESDAKPAWLLEMEAMEDEEGLTCAVCQEGRTYQPSEMLGLYAYMKKISIPYSKGGGRGTIDGTLMLLSLPPTLPESLRGTDQEDDWHLPSLSLASAMKSTSHGSSTLAASTSSVMGSRSCYFVITVTAGNAIHYSCHARARSADRNHPKAPKSEWEGASLRNSRVACNVILPLMSKENSKVPVMEMENALADHQSAVSNMLGSKPKSMLWTVLHDIRLLILRMSYGEALNNDCGGGSLSSNSGLIFYSLSLADMFARDAEHDSPVTVKHAQGLSLGFLSASSILRAIDYTKSSLNGKKLRRAFSDAAPMAAICCILFNNAMNDDGSSPADVSASPPPPKRRWELHKDHFLSGLLQCAGRRHALNIEGSGCVQASTGRRNRSSSFSDWNADDHGSPPSRRIIYGKRSGLSIEDYAKALRPMITCYALLDQLSKEFTLRMDDEKVEECSERLAGIAEKCQKAENIRTLISIAKITLDDTSIVEELEMGINTV